MSVSADAIIASQLQFERPDGQGDHPSSRPDIGLNGYWRKADGDIQLLDGGPNGFSVYVRKKWTFLEEYGLYSLTPTRNWNPMTDPYRPILLKGGIKEFRRAQIVELGWHRKPHPVIQKQIDVLVQAGVEPRKALDVAMPQLEGYEWETYHCPSPSCRGREFNAESELRSHEVLHREDVKTRQLGDAIATAVSSGQAASTETLAPLLKGIAEVVQTLAQAQAQDRDERRELQANFNALLAEIAKSNKSSK